MCPSHPDYIYWLAAAHLQGVGAVSLRQMLDAFRGCIRTLFSATPHELKRQGLTELQIEAFQNINWDIVKRDQEWCTEHHCQLLTFLDENYPLLLKETSAAPAALFVQGDVNLLSTSQLAIVGSRNPTPTGRELAENFALALSQAGLVITSGLALGIDAASHQGALMAQGKTIAVLGTGLGVIYPRSNQKLAQSILESGCLVSEFSPFTSASAKNFPMRNRIISGLSLGVLVVEAALRSGSLITARNAVEQNREVFAIPGSIHNPLARGCHQLIRQGAKLVETAKDILEELKIWPALDQKKTVNLLEKNNKPELKLLRHIDYSPTALDVILSRSRLTAGEVSSMLLSLELQGLIQTVTGGFIRR